MSEQLQFESGEAFEDTYGCDRVTATVLRNKYNNITHQINHGILSTSFSVILRDWYDFATGLTGPPDLDYGVAGMGNTLQLFNGCIHPGTRNMVTEYGLDNLGEGDVLLCADPMRLGAHVNDVQFVKPVFYDGDLVSFIVIRAHMQDVGGTVPAGFSAEKENVFENGLTTPPTKLYEAGEPVESTWKLYFDNSRFGDLVALDFKTIYTNLLRGEEMVTDLIDDYGTQAFHGAMRYALDYSERAMRNGIESLPDGTYHGEEWVDADGVENEEYLINATVTVRGDRAEVDFSGTARQANTSINAGYLDTQTAVMTAFKYLLDPDTPITSAALRPIDVILPEGTILSARPPEAPIFLYWEATEPALYSIMRALEDPLGDDAVAGAMGSINIHNANGVWPETGEPWVTQAQCGGEHGPWGGTEAGDADSYQILFLANNLDPATESIENDAPVMITRKEYVTDSAGPGKHRGGASVLKDSFWRHESQHFVMPLHFRHPSGFGVYGGEDGQTGGVWLWTPNEWDMETEGKVIPKDSSEVYASAEPIGGRLDSETNEPDLDGEYVYPYTEDKASGRWIESESTFRWVTNAGGGWGDPLDRAPEKVRRDVRDEYVSIQGAREDYGVVVEGDPQTDPEEIEIDQEATEELRERRRAQRTEGAR